VTVHRITAAGGVEQIEQQPLDFGVTVHQVRITPPGTIAVVPACAHHESASRPARSASSPIARDGSHRSRAYRPILRAPRRGTASVTARTAAARHVDFHHAAVDVSLRRDPR
jgi:hypothetical protein